MKCPRCVQQIHRAAAACPHCGFHIDDADARFGEGEVRLQSLTDAAGLMRRSERTRVMAAMDRISRRFPQIFVAVYTGSLGEMANLRQFGFWLLNRAAFDDVPAEKPNEAGILLTIDAESKSAGITVGYLLDPFIEETDTFDCLSRAHAYWLEGHYADGIIKALAHLSLVLKKRGRQARRDPERFERKTHPPVTPSGLIRRLRDGHRRPTTAEPSAAASETSSETHGSPK